MALPLRAHISLSIHFAVCSSTLQAFCRLPHRAACDHAVAGSAPCRLLLARTLLSSAMMIIYSFQSGRARLGASRWAPTSCISGFVGVYRCPNTQELFGSVCYERGADLHAALFPLKPGCLWPDTCCREHASHLRQVAGKVKRCCQSLAAILRDNAPVRVAAGWRTGLCGSDWLGPAFTVHMKAAAGSTACWRRLHNRCR